MITIGDISTALLMVILWAFVAVTWVCTYTFYKDLNEWRDVEGYAMVVIVGTVSVALTILLALFTLCAMGIVEG